MSFSLGQVIMARSTSSIRNALRWQDKLWLFDELVLGWLSFGQQRLDSTHYETVLQHPIFSDPESVNSWEEKGCTQRFVHTVISGQYENTFPPPPPQTRKILKSKSSSSRRPHPYMSSLPIHTSKGDEDWIPDESDISDGESESGPDVPPSVETMQLKNPDDSYGGSQWKDEDLNSALRLTSKPTPADKRIPFLQKASAYRNRCLKLKNQLSQDLEAGNAQTDQDERKNQSDITVSPVRSDSTILSPPTPPGETTIG